jgi:hypothetical protein
MAQYVQSERTRRTQDTGRRTARFTAMVIGASSSLLKTSSDSISTFLPSLPTLHIFCIMSASLVVCRV